MASLYELTDEFLEWKERIEDPECSTEQMQEALAQMTLTKDNIQSKISGYMRVYAETKGNLDMVDAEIARLKERSAMLKEKTEALLNQVLTSMQIVGFRKMETDLFSLSIRPGRGKVVVTDEDLIMQDPRFVTISQPKQTVNKKALKEALDRGEQIEGAEISIEDSLVVK